MPKSTYDNSYTQNRELSWLKFNERVLEEAADTTVPLYERLKFVSIFCNNLDEFFMIRVGSLTDLTLIKEDHIDNKTGMTPQEQLDGIFKAVPPLYKRKDELYEAIQKDLEGYGIHCITSSKELDKKERKYLDQYFQKVVRPILSPQIIDRRHPFPHLTNKTLNIIVTLKEGAEPLYGLIPVPQSLPRVVYLPGEEMKYVLLEQMILTYAKSIFDTYNILNKAIICITRNADISLDEEAVDEDEDYRHYMKKILKKRSRLAPVRLEIQGELSSEAVSFLCKRLDLHKARVFRSKTPLELSYVFGMLDKIPSEIAGKLTYTPFDPQYPVSLDPRKSVMKQVLEQDVLLYYPYEQMDPFLQLIKESAYDPDVLSIKITIYRLAGKSKLVQYLIEAAENGKEVSVLMELRARFDEQNNINWSEALEEAGCKINYGFENYKVHSKICLITRKDEDDRIQYITQIGTGNYNEKTAKLYTDLCLMTAKEDIGNDAAEFFKNMAISNLNGNYSSLLVAPVCLKSKLIDEIDREIEKGEQGRICMKMNSLTDREMIDKLAAASQAGVKVDLIIRGICCLLPSIEGKTDNITVRSIVGRYLEHPRIYCFGTQAEDGNTDDVRIYIGSADLMTRNTEKRVEIACPVNSSDLKRVILEMLEVMLRDNVKARLLQNNGQYKLIEMQDDDNVRLDSQEYFMQQAVDNDRGRGEFIKQENVGVRIKRFFGLSL